MTAVTSAKARQPLSRQYSKRQNQFRRKATMYTPNSSPSPEQLINDMASLEIKHQWRPSTVDPNKNVALTLAQRKKWLPHSTRVPSPLRKTTSAEDLPDVTECDERIPMNRVLKAWDSDSDLRTYVTSFDEHSRDIESHVRAAFKQRCSSSAEPSASNKKEEPNPQQSQDVGRLDDKAVLVQPNSDGMSVIDYACDDGDSDWMDIGEGYDS